MADKTDPILVVGRIVGQSVTAILPDGRQLVVGLRPAKRGQAGMRLAIQAPADVRLVRSELLEQPATSRLGDLAGGEHALMPDCDSHMKVLPVVVRKVG